MLKTKHLCLALVFVASAQMSNAATQDGEYVIRGIGASQCSYLIEDYSRNTNKQLELTNWVAGYVTHINKTDELFFDAIPFENTKHFSALVSLVCKSQPTAQIQKVVEALFSHLEPYKPKKKSEFELVKSDTHRISIRSETVKEVQLLLAEHSYLGAEDIDGKFGPKTSKALLKFQDQEKLAVTGVPDTLTLVRLLALKK